MTYATVQQRAEVGKTLSLKNLRLRHRYTDDKLLIGDPKIKLKLKNISKREENDS